MEATVTRRAGALARLRSLSEPRRWWLLGATLGMLGVALGAFGAHAVKDSVSPDDYDTYKIAAQYHMMHALALFAVAFAAERWPGRAASFAGWSFTAGILLFSGSLYVVATAGLNLLGAVTPLGGVAFLAGWGALAWLAWSRPAALKD